MVIEYLFNLRIFFSSKQNLFYLEYKSVKVSHRTCTVVLSDADVADECSWVAPPCLVFSLLDVEAADEDTGLPICWYRTLGSSHVVAFV